MRALSYAVFAVSSMFLGASVAQAQTLPELEALRQQAGELFSKAKYSEALSTQRAVAAGVEKAENASAGAPGP